jgi:hypothetical protein
VVKWSDSDVRLCNFNKDRNVITMSSSQQAQIRTRMCARVVGPFLTVVTVTAVARASQLRTLLSEFDASSVWAWVTGAFVLLSGLVVIALHPYWRGAAAIIVSVLGWLTALKGLFLLAFPETSLSVADSAIQPTIWWQTGFVVMALIGLYLSYVGWAPAPSRPVSEATTSTPDLPRVA